MLLWTSRHQRQKAELTLLHFAKALTGMPVAVELRYDTIVKGKLEDVDASMNLTMTGVSMQHLQGTAQTLDFMYIKGRHIRYIHLPGSLDVTTAIENHRTRAREDARMNARDTVIPSCTNIRHQLAAHASDSISQPSCPGISH